MWIEHPSGSAFVVYFPILLSKKLQIEVFKLLHLLKQNRGCSMQNDNHMNQWWLKSSPWYF
jgi:hypothetical protein